MNRFNKLINLFFALADIDECSNTDLNKCSDKSRCTNTVGGYKCGCTDGSVIGQDLRTCQRMS